MITWKPGDAGWYWHRLPHGAVRIHVTVRTVSEDRRFLRVKLAGPSVYTITYDRLRPNSELPERLRRSE